MTTVRNARQGSQPTFGVLRVGIMRVGLADGAPLAQLALRTPSDEAVVVLDEGDAFELDGVGTLHLDEIRASEGTVRGEVTLRFEEVDDAD